MGRITLIRHGEAENAGKRCIGRTDIPLSKEGERHAERLAGSLTGTGIERIYTSPLSRCRATAEILGNDLGIPVEVCQELVEVDVGDWEGLPFSEIRERWPEAYEARGVHLGTTAPPGGETFLEAGERLMHFVLQRKDENCAAVTHAGIIRGFVTSAEERNPDNILEIPQPNAGITDVLIVLSEGKISGGSMYDGYSIKLNRIGVRPWLLDDADIDALYRKAQTPEEVKAHCRAVAELAEKIAGKQQIPLDVQRLRAAALLHDLYRANGRTHPRDAAVLLIKEGWPDLAELVESHHNIQEGMSAEVEILALADALTQGTERVTLEERFTASRKKCRDAEAVAAWQRRYDEAMRVYQKYMKGRS